MVPCDLPKSTPLMVPCDPLMIPMNYEEERRKALKFEEIMRIIGIIS
jgi:hypothetical protein